MPRFVVRKHHATSHHFDLRLEKDGALVSQAIPKDTPEDTKKNRLAVVNETPVEGVRGAARRGIRDGGTCGAGEFGEEMVVARPRGGRLDGRYAIFRAVENWPLHKIEPTGEA